MLLAMPIPTDSWVDDDGNMVMTTVNMGLFQLKMLAATKEQAIPALPVEHSSTVMPGLSSPRRSASLNICR